MLVMASTLMIELDDVTAIEVIRDAIDEDEDCFVASSLWMVQGGCVECPEYIEEPMEIFLRSLITMHRVGVKGSIQLADSDGCLMHYATIYETGVVLRTKDARWSIERSVVTPVTTDTG